MTQFMLSLDAVLRRHRRAVLAAWIVALVAAVPFAARQSDHLTGGGYDVPGSQSKAALQAIDRDFPGQRTSSLGVVLVPSRDASTADVRRALARVQDVTRAVPDVALTRTAKRAALAQMGAGRPLDVPLALATSEDHAIDIAVDLRARLRDDGGPVRAHLIGQGALWASMQEVSKRDLAHAERAGFPLVALVLLAVFGSFAAASLPLALGFVSVVVTGALIYWLSRATEMSVFVTNMASMIGIGVAVDYSLFVLARYREEIRDGVPRDAARARALATSGVAVAFSGATVIVSLAGLFLVDTTAIRSMALGAILVVAVSVLAASTLLPALMSLLGRRAYARSRAFQVVPLVLRTWRRRRPGSTRADAAARPRFWARWTELVMRRPVVSVLLAAAVLGALTVPAFSMATGDGALRQLPRDDTTRVGFAAAARGGAGAGDSSPIRIVVRGGGTRDVWAVRRTLASEREVQRVLPTVVSRDRHSALVAAVPRHDGEAPETKALIRRLRGVMPANASVGGASAAQVDFNHAVEGSLWKIALFVFALSYFVLLVLLRSVVLPLKAALMNLLSVGAAYGVLVAAFQWGWLGFAKTGHLDTVTPPIVLAVVFGLSMDYEVFLLTRIRERYEATGSTRRAVAEGLASSARTITSAALIMVAVFAVFAGTSLPAIKQLGLGCAVAIALDATLVRLVLVPAAMQLLDRWNWWLPRPLSRVLPRVGLERLPAGAAGD